MYSERHWMVEANIRRHHENVNFYVIVISQTEWNNGGLTIFFSNYAGPKTRINQCACVKCELNGMIF